jgi:hypothetical protein
MGRLALDGSFHDFEDAPPRSASALVLNLDIAPHVVGAIQKIRCELDALDRASDAYWRRWRAVGELLLSIRGEFGSNRAFGAALGALGVTLSSYQRSAAQWLARMSPDEIDSLRARFPTAHEPVSLQRRHTEAFGGARKRRETPSPAEPETACVPDAHPEHAGPDAERASSAPLGGAAADEPAPAMDQAAEATRAEATAESDAAVDGRSVALAGLPNQTIATPSTGEPSASLVDLHCQLAEIEDALAAAARARSWPAVRVAITRIAAPKTAISPLVAPAA